MFLDRIFSYKALEARLADKDQEIKRLVEDVKELRDRLFIKHSLPVSGAEVTTAKVDSIQGWAPKRARLKQYIDEQQPLAAPPLSAEELQMLREASQ